MKEVVFKFGVLAFALLALFQLSKYTLLAPSFSDEMWIAIFAVLFIALGIVMSRQFKIGAAGAEVVELDADRIQELNISKREYEVLQHLADGKSNKEIAADLFLSESTVKTHVSNLLTKLDSKRRTQAVMRAKQLKILD